MAKDDRIWGKFAVDMPDNPKILPLSDKAFRCLIEATLYSRRMLTDGFLASRLAVAKWGVDALQELASNDPERPSLVEVDGGWQIRDYADHQDTRAEVEARRERARIAGSSGGKAKAANVKRPASKPLSNPSSGSLPETETERDKDSLPNGRESVAAKRGSRLTPEWKPTQETIDKIRTEHPSVDLKAEHEAFTDYWIAQPGQKGVKLDWDATWRNWMRNTAKRARPVKPTPTERAMQTAQAGRQVAGRLVTSLNPKELK